LAGIDMRLKRAVIVFELLKVRGWLVFINVCWKCVVKLLWIWVLFDDWQVWIKTLKQESTSRQTVEWSHLHCSASRDNGERRPLCGNTRSLVTFVEFVPQETCLKSIAPPWRRCARIINFGCTVLPHPPFSHYLTPWDYRLRGHRYANDNALQNAVRQWL
jgi:hypothetical protein